NVGGIDTALQAPVHAKPDHAFEPFLVAFDKDSEGSLVALPGGFLQLSVCSRVSAHDRVHILLHGKKGRTFTPLETILSFRVLSCRRLSSLAVSLAAGAPAQRIARAVPWLKDHFADPLRIESLAKHAADAGRGARRSRVQRTFASPPR